jgi:hypothetical protein
MASSPNEACHHFLMKRRCLQMNWKPARFLIEGRLDNSRQDKVMGWMKFAGLREKVTLDIEGNFHRDVRGTKIRFTGDAYEDQAEIDSKDYFRGFALHQTGKVGNMTAGLPPGNYRNHSRLEWR